MTNGSESSRAQSSKGERPSKLDNSIVPTEVSALIACPVAGTVTARRSVPELALRCHACIVPNALGLEPLKLSLAVVHFFVVGFPAVRAVDDLEMLATAVGAFEGPTSLRDRMRLSAVPFAFQRRRWIRSDDRHVLVSVIQSMLDCFLVSGSHAAPVRRASGRGNPLSHMRPERRVTHNVSQATAYDRGLAQPAQNIESSLLLFTPKYRHNSPKTAMRW